MRARQRTEHDNSGFTIIELMIALGIAAFALVALATMMVGTLRALAVQKTRTQGNEFATLGIEDLQRLDFDRLAFCPDTTNDPNPLFIPPTLMDTAQSPAVPLEKVVAGQGGAAGSCAGVTYSDPCTPPAAALSAIPVPRQVVTCRRNNISYTVNRYIVWADAAKTNKRLAVFVEWVDQVGRHRVAQQSSLRIPNAASIYGGPPPQILSVSATGSGGAGCPATVPASVTCAVISSVDGSLVSTLSLSASTSGLTTPADAVSVNLQTRSSSGDGTGTLATAIPLTSGDGSLWSKDVLAGGFQARPGDQVLYVTAARANDGKTNSRFVTGSIVRFCTETGDCGTSGPVFTGTPTLPGTIDIDNNGVVQGSAEFTATVTGLDPTVGDYVTMGMQTAKGAVLIPMEAPSSGCSGAACEVWKFTLTNANGYRFNSGVQPVYFSATKQAIGANPGASTIYTPPPSVNIQ